MFKKPIVKNILSALAVAGSHQTTLALLLHRNLGWSGDAACRPFGCRNLGISSEAVE